MRRHQPFILALAVVLVPLPAFAQSPFETKQRFVAAVIDFLEAAPGLYGDEGARLSASVEAMDAGLRRWDVAVDAYQRATTTQLAGATPSVAAALHVPLGAIYLERGRVSDALREFDATTDLDPQRRNIHLFRMLAFDSIHMADAAASAAQQAWRLDPENPVQAYAYLRHASSDAYDVTKSQAIQALAKAVESGAQNNRPGVASPFLQVKLLDEPPNRDPIFPQVRYAAAFSALESGNYEEAVRRFRDAVAGDPLVVDQALPSDPVRRGIATFREGQIRPAIDLLLEGSRRAPRSSEAHRILAIAYWFDEQFGNAIEHFQEAVRLNPNDERSRTMLADVYSDAKEFDSAEQTLRDGLAVMPGSGQAHWMLGRLYQGLQREVEARVEFERSLSLNPVVGAARLHRTIARWYLNETNVSAAANAAAHGVDLDPNDPVAHKEFGNMLRTAGRDDDALVELLVSAWLDPTDADTYLAVGQAYLAAEKYEPAMIVLRRAVTERPRHAASRYALASALLRGGKDTEGAQQMELARQFQVEALAESRRSYEMNLLKIDAALKSQEGNYQESAQVWLQVAVLEPQLPSNHISLGEAFARAGRHQEAVAAFSAALKLSPEPSLHRSLAREYAAMGRQDDAEHERRLYQEIKGEQLRRLGTSR